MCLSSNFKPQSTENTPFKAGSDVSVAATVLDMSSGSVKNVLAEQGGIYRRFAES